METRTMVYSASYQEANIRRNYMTGVFGWMTLALTVSGLIAGWIGDLPAALHTIADNRALFIVVFVLEIILVTGLSILLSRLSIAGAAILLLGYALLNGITLPALFYIFTPEPIAPAFYLLALTFGLASLYGYLSGKDMSRPGNIAGLLLAGLFTLAVVNYLLQSSLFHWVLSYAVLTLALLLTAYNVRKIKSLSERASIDRSAWPVSAVMGALLLYLDFLNFFLFFLRIFGKKK